VSVASGKGASPLAARVAALAEALERYCAEPRGRWPQVVARRGELAGRSLDPRRLILPEDFDPAWPVDWCRGNALDDAALWVPVNAVVFPYHPSANAVRLLAAHTHGLAAGSTRAEAVVHGLLECIERDAYSRAVALASTGRGDAVPVVDLDAARRETADRIDRLTAAGLHVQLRDVTADTEVVTLLCTITDGELCHLGIASHPDGRQALRRAIDEAAQSRLVDLQGAREDLPPRDGAPVDPWFVSAGGARVVDVPVGWPPRSMGEALGALRDRLIRLDIEPVVVDLSLPDVDMAVVRVIAPGLEVWAFDPSRIGSRARAWLTPP
jgi:YcaO-like protein with predicted kinase domain